MLWVRVLVLGLIFLISCEQQLWEVDFVRLDDLWFHQFNLFSIGCLKLQKMLHLTLLVQDPMLEISRWCAPKLFCFWDANMVSVCCSEKGKKEMETDYDQTNFCSRTHFFLGLQNLVCFRFVLHSLTKQRKDILFFWGVGYLDCQHILLY